MYNERMDPDKVKNIVLYVVEKFGKSSSHAELVAEMSSAPIDAADRKWETMKKDIDYIIREISRYLYDDDITDMVATLRGIRTADNFAMMNLLGSMSHFKNDDNSIKHVLDRWIEITKLVKEQGI